MTDSTDTSVGRRLARAARAALILTLAISSTLLAQPPDKPGKLKFRGASFPVSEEAGQVVIVVKRQGGSDGDVTVDYATTAGSATVGEDFEEVSGTLEWADGDRSDRTFTVPILDDDEDEPQETFGLILSNPTGGATLQSPSSTTVRIKPSDRSDDDDDGDDDDGDDDDEGGEIELTSSSFVAFESSGEATFTVARSGGSAGLVTVDYITIDGSALAGEDYVLAEGTLTWDDGVEGELLVTFPLIDDAVEEDLETVSIVLTNVTGGAVLGARAVGSVIIVDDDGSEGSCVPDEETLCLGGGRFQITGSWEDFDGNTGPFRVIPATDETGLIWFFDDGNIELLVKILDGCPVNGHFWVFFAATTNVGFDMEVVDLLADETRTYENPVGVIPQATTDVTAFATCDL